MMRASNTSLTCFGLSVVALAACSGFMLWPAVAASDSRTAECGRLLARAAQHDVIALERDRVRGDLADARASASRVLRTIPRDADQAHLMRMLAVGTGPDVGTQTIVAGVSLPATPAANSAFRAIPVTVEMKATFARVMEVLARAECDKRLVRPIHIAITRPAVDPSTARGAGGSNASPDTGVPLVEARIELDAVFGGAVAAAGEEQP